MTHTKIMLVILKTFMLMAVAISAAQRANGQTPVVTGYYCTPQTCLNIATGTGYFNSTMYMTATFSDGDFKVSRTISRTIWSNGCTSSVTLTTYGDTTSNPVLGGGILVHADGEQFGATLIETQITRYMYGSNSFTQPSPSVPCV